jgi:hypothetical protein
LLVAHSEEVKIILIDYPPPHQPGLLVALLEEVDPALDEIPQENLMRNHSVGFEVVPEYLDYANYSNCNLIMQIQIIQIQITQIQIIQIQIRMPQRRD